MLKHGSSSKTIAIIFASTLLTLKHVSNHRGFFPKYKAEEGGEAVASVTDDNAGLRGKDR
jgi:hypothetical protein